MIINKQTKGTELYEITYIPKGTSEAKTVYVYAKNRLDASNYLINKKMYGKQLEVRYCNVNLMK